MSNPKLELARRSTEAWSQRDAEWFVDNCTPDFEFVPAVITTVEGQGGAVRGAEGIRQFFAELDEPWESFRVDVDEYREVDGQVVCVGHVRARGRGSGVELDQPVSMVLWFRDEKMVCAHSFLDPDAAIDAAAEAAR